MVAASWWRIVRTTIGRRLDDNTKVLGQASADRKAIYSPLTMAIVEVDPVYRHNSALGLADCRAFVCCTCPLNMSAEYVR